MKGAKGEHRRRADEGVFQGRLSDQIPTARHDRVWSPSSSGASSPDSFSEETQSHASTGLGKMQASLRPHYFSKLPAGHELVRLVNRAYLLDRHIQL